MATEKEAKVVYAAGLVQGIVLVTFPAASTIFTDPGEYDLSNTQSTPASSARSTTPSAPGAAGVKETSAAPCTISTRHGSWRQPGWCETAPPSH